MSITKGSNKCKRRFNILDTITTERLTFYTKSRYGKTPLHVLALYMYNAALSSALHTPTESGRRTQTHILWSRDTRANSCNHKVRCTGIPDLPYL